MKCYIARILQLETGPLDIMVVIFNIMYKETYQHLYHHSPQDELEKIKPIWLFHPC